MEAVSREVEVKLANGLHLRPIASLLRRLASYEAQAIMYCRERKADARSMAGLLALGASCGTRVTVSVRGRDAQGALQAIEAVLTEAE